jgi:hypothetical protein
LLFPIRRLEGNTERIDPMTVSVQIALFPFATLMQRNEAINHDMLSFSIGAKSPNHSPNTTGGIPDFGVLGGDGQTGRIPINRRESSHPLAAALTEDLVAAAQPVQRTA